MESTMADDNYQEGVDFKWVISPGTNAKTRHFFTKAEKQAKANPPATRPAPKAASKKPAAPVYKTKEQTDKNIAKYRAAHPSATTPAAKPPVKQPARNFSATPDPFVVGQPGSNMKSRLGNVTGAEWDAMTREQRRGKGLPESWVDYVKVGGNASVKSDKPVTKADALRTAQTAKDKRIAAAKATYGEGRQRSADTQAMRELMTGRKGAAAGYKTGGVVKMKEGSAKDIREDKTLAKKSGMSMKKWEKSAADVKHDKPSKMAKGGTVRGTGAATRGKNFSGSY